MDSTRPQLPPLTSPQHLLAAPDSSRKNIVWAILGYIFFPIPMFFVSKENEFVWFHIRQSFGIFLGSVVVYLLNNILGLYILALVINVALFGIWCVGIANVLYGKQKELPVIGKFSEKYRIF